MRLHRPNSKMLISRYHISVDSGQQGGELMGSSSGQPITRVAVFDFDGTSISGQSGALFTRYLLFRRLMSPPRALRLIWWGIRYKLHLPYRQDEARELVLGALSEMSAPEVDELMVRFHDEVLRPRYRPQALEELARCQGEGMVALLVSATFDAMAAQAARIMGFDGYAATRMVRDAQGNYTGAVDGPVVAGAEKYRAVVRWCDQHLGEGAWRLERAYGDHHTDKDLLSHARVAVAVCPGKTLRVLAKRRGWTIADWDE